MHSSPLLIGIAGPSCSGKTTVARQLVRSLPGPATRLPLDAYYRDLDGLPPELVPTTNFDHPDALDHDRLSQDLSQLAAGRLIEIPRYDFSSHTRRTTGRSVHPGAWVVVEGIFALYWEALRELWRLSVWVDLDDHAGLERRIERDISERGRTRASVIAQYEETVRPMYREFVEPTRRFADLILDGKRPADESVGRILERLAPGS